MKNSKNRPFLILGKNIAQRRDKLGLNQDLFADEVGTSLTGLKNIERGVAEGHINTRMAIAQYFKCSLADLYKDPADQTKDVSFAADFFSKLASLPPDAQGFVFAFVSHDRDLLATVPEDLLQLIQSAPKAKRVKS